MRFHGNASAVNPAADTAVILVWMSGGPGHHETWDPKPDAVAQYRGPFGAIATNLPGAVLKIIHGAGHLAMLENPAEVNAVIAAFLHSLD